MKEKRGEKEAEVEQIQNNCNKSNPLLEGGEMNKAIGNSGGENVVKNLEVENVAESLGAVAIAGSKAKGQAKGTSGRKTAWNMKKIEEYCRLVWIEEVILRQRSRALWLRDDDRNTKFFHGKENQRRKKNHIAKLKDDKGIWWRGEKHCERILLSYFSDIFSSSGLSNIEEVCQVMKGKINSQQKLWCQAPYSSLEVKEVLKQMHPLKASGLDILPALFY
ncbi:unnamed protein product [Vicia faba]|uniref:Uncharacterized protein n=1 Tax=Vicia faba TaxID=3906 RepID=A0AAV0YG79_VICFA|nr:unnamed protein product [Vicia faba]